MSQKRFLSRSWKDYICFVENYWGGAVHDARAGREADGWGGEEGLLGCGNRRYKTEQAGVQSTHSPWY